MPVLINQGPLGLRETAQRINENEEFNRDRQEMIQASVASPLTKGWTAAGLSEKANKLLWQANQAKIAGDPTQAEALHQEGLRAMNQAAIWAPPVQNFTDINSVGDAVDWAGGALGNVRSSVAPAVGGMVGGALGGLITRTPVGIRAGSMLGSGVVGYNQMTEEAGGNALMSPDIVANKTPEQIRDAARVSGAVQAPMEALVPAMMSGKLLGLGAKEAAKKTLARTVGAEMLRESSGEFATEFGQDLTGQATQNYLRDKALADNLDYKQALNAGAAGAVAGGGMAMVGGAGEYAHTRAGQAADSVKDVAKDPVGKVADMVTDAGAALGTAAAKVKGAFEDAADKRAAKAAGLSVDEYLAKKYEDTLNGVHERGPNPNLDPVSEMERYDTEGNAAADKVAERDLNNPDVSIARAEAAQQYKQDREAGASNAHEAYGEAVRAAKQGAEKAKGLLDSALNLLGDGVESVLGKQPKKRSSAMSTKYGGQDGARGVVRVITARQQPATDYGTSQTAPAPSTTNVPTKPVRGKPKDDQEAAYRAEYGIYFNAAPDSPARTLPHSDYAKLDKLLSAYANGDLKVPPSPEGAKADPFRTKLDELFGGPEHTERVLELYHEAQTGKLVQTYGQSTEELGHSVGLAEEEGSDDVAHITDNDKGWQSGVSETRKPEGVVRYHFRSGVDGYDNETPEFRAKYDEKLKQLRETSSGRISGVGLATAARESAESETQANQREEELIKKFYPQAFHKQEYAEHSRNPESSLHNLRKRLLKQIDKRFKVPKEVFKDASDIDPIDIDKSELRVISGDSASNVWGIEVGKDRYLDDIKYGTIHLKMKDGRDLRTGAMRIITNMQKAAKEGAFQGETAEELGATKAYHLFLAGVSSLFDTNLFEGTITFRVDGKEQSLRKGGQFPDGMALTLGKGSSPLVTVADARAQMDQQRRSETSEPWKLNQSERGGVQYAETHDEKVAAIEQKIDDLQTRADGLVKELRGQGNKVSNTKELSGRINRLLGFSYSLRDSLDEYRNDENVVDQIYQDLRSGVNPDRDKEASHSDEWVKGDATLKTSEGKDYTKTKWQPVAQPTETEYMTEGMGARSNKDNIVPSEHFDTKGTIHRDEHGLSPEIHGSSADVVEGARGSGKESKDTSELTGKWGVQPKVESKPEQGVATKVLPKSIDFANDKITLKNISVSDAKDGGRMYEKDIVMSGVRVGGVNYARDGQTLKSVEINIDDKFVRNGIGTRVVAQLAKGQNAPFKVNGDASDAHREFFKGYGLTDDGTIQRGAPNLRKSTGGGKPASQGKVVTQQPSQPSRAPAKSGLATGVRSAESAEGVKNSSTFDTKVEQLLSKERVEDRVRGMFPLFKEITKAFPLKKDTPPALNKLIAGIDETLRTDDLKNYLEGILSGRVSPDIVEDNIRKVTDLEESDLGPFEKAETLAVILEEAEGALEESNKRQGRLLSKQSPNPNKGTNYLEHEAVLNAIKKLVGDKVAVNIVDELTDNGKQISGQWQEKLIQISALATDMYGTGRHEAMHQLFQWLREAGATETLKTLDNLGKNQIIIKRLKYLLREHPDAMNQLSDPEEVAAYAFQFWHADQSTGEFLSLGPKTQTLFEKLKSLLARAADSLRAALFDDAGAKGRISDREMMERTNEIFGMFAEGTMSKDHSRNEIISTLEKLNKASNNKTESSNKVVQSIKAFSRKALVTTGSLYEESSNPFWKEIGSKFFQFEGAKQDHQPYLDRFNQVLDQKSSQVRNILLKYDEDTRKAASQYLREERATDDIKHDEARKLVGEVREFLGKMMQYLRDAKSERWDAEKQEWVPMGEVKENYWPRVYDLDKILENQAEFINTLAADLDAERAKGGFKEIADKDWNAANYAHAILGRLQSTNGTQDIDETTNDMGITPFMASVNKRELTFLDPKKYAKYMQEDMASVLTNYTAQAVKRAEYRREFGRGGEDLRNLIDSALIHEINPELVAKSKLLLSTAINEWRDALIAASSAGESFNKPLPTLRSVARDLSDIPKEEYDAKMAKVLDKAQPQIMGVQAMEGTLGHDIDPKRRQLLSAMTTYQNFRLLTLSLFGSITDPLGMVVRGGTLNDAWNGFVRGLREVKMAWKDEYSQDKLAQLAEKIGTVSAGNYLDSISSQTYSSLFMHGKLRRFNDALFKWNGMEAWNRAMRIQATGAAVEFIKKHVKEPNKHSKRYLQELFGEKEGALDNVLGADGELNMENPKVKEAIFRWVNGAILRPNASQRPVYASDPHYAIFYHLKQFAYSFHKTILRRAYLEAKEGNYAPGAALFTTFIPVAIASDAVKEVLIPGDDPPWTKGGLGAYLKHGFERANLTGVPGMYLGNLSDPVAIFGPTPDEVGDFLKVPLFEDAKLSREMLGALPGGNLFRRLAGN